jgi:hypothetical protein
VTLPRERYAALKNAKKVMRLIFLRGNARPSLTELRRIIYYALKHYPTDYELEQLPKKLPKLFEDDET